MKVSKKDFDQLLVKLNILVKRVDQLEIEKNELKENPKKSLLYTDIYIFNLLQSAYLFLNLEKTKPNLSK